MKILIFGIFASEPNGHKMALKCKVSSNEYAYLIPEAWQFAHFALRSLLFIITEDDLPLPSRHDMAKAYVGSLSENISRNLYLVI